jgi:hypothetical protein
VFDSSKKRIGEFSTKNKQSINCIISRIKEEAGLWKLTGAPISLVDQYGVAPLDPGSFYLVI